MIDAETVVSPSPPQTEVAVVAAIAASNETLDQTKPNKKNKPQSLSSLVPAKRVLSVARQCRTATSISSMFRVGLLTRVAFRPAVANALQPKTLLQNNVASSASFPTVNAALMVQSRGMASKKHKKIIKLAKGYRGRANRCYSVAYHRVLKAQQYAYRDRKVKKREMRKLWILRVNAASRMYGVPYSNLINMMANSRVQLDRKVLADMAITEPLSFRSVVEVMKSIFPKA